MRSPAPLKSLSALAKAGLISATDVARLESVTARYAVSVTPAIASLIAAQDPNDPIGRQFLPQIAELTTTAEERADPVGDYAKSPVPGVVHRYPDRALLKLTHTCAVYCRFCFRREMIGPGGDGDLTGEALKGALDYIASHGQIWEVILTGGDPLVLSNRRLHHAAEALRAMDHVKVLRLHSRAPVADPQRIDAGLISALQASGKAVYLAVHANHAREFSPQARAACARLAEAGIPLLGQTVLLKGVNDTVEALSALFRTMVETRIKPYYLHHPDLSPGTSHFRLSLQEGQALMRGLRGDISGLCQPTYVLDIPGGAGKAPVGPNYLSQSPGSSDQDAQVWVEDPFGERHPYSDSQPSFSDQGPP